VNVGHFNQSQLSLDFVIDLYIIFRFSKMSLLSCLLLVWTLMACSAASPGKNIQDVKIMASTDEAMARGSWFGIGSLIKQKIKNKKKLFTSIIGKKKSIKSKRSLFGIGSQPLFGIGSLSKQKIQNKKKLIQQKIQNKKKFFSTIIGKKKSIKNKRAVLDSAKSPKENDEAKMMASTDESMARGSWFGIGSLIKQKIQNKKKFVSSIIGKKKSIKNKRAVLDSAESTEENRDASKTRGSS